MRLIDADNLKEEMLQRANIEWTYENGNAIRVETIKYYIDDAETIYPEEVSKFIEMCIRELPQLIEAITKNLPQLIEEATEKIIEEDTRSEQARWRDGE